MLLKSFFESDCSAFVHGSIIKKIKLKLLSKNIIFYLLKVGFRQAIISPYCSFIYYICTRVPTSIVGPLPFNFWFIGI